MKSLATKTKSSPTHMKKTGTQRRASVRPNSATMAQVRDIIRPHGLQTKLSIGRPGDRYEQEADEVADRVVAGLPIPQISSLAPGSLQKQPVEEEEELLQTKLTDRQGDLLLHRQVESKKDREEEYIQEKAKGQARQFRPSFETKVNAMKGGGKSLPINERRFFDSRFRTNFSNVRIHADSNANQLAKSLNARAFTYGHDIVFGKGEYVPDSKDGKKILGHELVHVLQQNNNVIQLKGKPYNDSDIEDIEYRKHPKNSGYGKFYWTGYELGEGGPIDMEKKKTWDPFGFGDYSRSHINKKYESTIVAHPIAYNCDVKMERWIIWTTITEHDYLGNDHTLIVGEEYRGSTVGSGCRKQEKKGSVFKAKSLDVPMDISWKSVLSVIGSIASIIGLVARRGKKIPGTLGDKKESRYS